MPSLRPNRAGTPGGSRPALLRVIDLLPHTDNIRENVTPELQELADSIKEHGILQPLLVTERPPTPGSSQQYTIVAGHRRAKAAFLAGLAQVPCTIRDVNDHAEEMILMLVENTHRRDLNPIEQALALSALMLRYGLSQAELAKKVGRSQPWVSNRLGFLELSEIAQRRLVTGEMTVAQGERLVRAGRIEDPKKAEPHERGWFPPYLTTTHFLAKKVKEMCDGREHNGRQRVGKVGCGQCWEQVIRSDERKVIEIEQRENDGSGADAAGEGARPKRGDTARARNR